MFIIKHSVNLLPSISSKETTLKLSFKIQNCKKKQKTDAPW